jgi:MtN3 and saliva related transmembrane protein
VNTTLLAVVAASWGVVMGAAPVLQVRRILATGSSRDVSLSFLAVYVLGFGFWLAYGASLGNVAIVVPNVVSLVVGATTLAIAVRYRRRTTSSPSPSSSDSSLRTSW